MDDSVVRALAKWPDVPAVYGWLHLDQRGQWRLKDEVVRHAGLAAFLGRNYASDAHGNWYVQNGPQRVYVTLDYTPWVIRLGADSQLETHTGLALTKLSAAMLDNQGQLLIESEHGIAVVSDRDLPTLLDAVWNADQRRANEAELLTLMHGDDSQLVFRWGSASLALTAIHTSEIPTRYRYVMQPSLKESGLSA